MNVSDRCPNHMRGGGSAAYTPRPFDRVLVALAQAHLTVLTSDQNIPKYPGVHTLW